MYLYYLKVVCLVILAKLDVREITVALQLGNFFKLR